ncbi:MAG: hypothetical protein ACPGSL_10080 [Vicingaceae bacterium]
MKTEIQRIEAYLQMVRKIFLLALIIILNLLGSSLYSQNDSILSNAIYATTYGVKNDKPLLDNVQFVLKSEGEFSIEVEKFIDDEGNRFRDVFNIWMVRCNGNYYYPFSVSGGTGKEYIRILKEYIGKHYLMFSVEVEQVDEKNRILNSSGVVIGIAAASLVFSSGSGVLLYVPVKEIKLGKYWVKKNNKWGYIYFIDTEESLSPRAKILNKRRLKKLYPKDKELSKRIDNNEVSFEEAVDLLEKLNN